MLLLLSVGIRKTSLTSLVRTFHLAIRGQWTDGQPSNKSHLHLKAEPRHITCHHMCITLPYTSAMCSSGCLFAWQPLCGHHSLFSSNYMKLCYTYCYSTALASRVRMISMTEGNFFNFYLSICHISYQIAIFTSFSG